MEKSTTLLLILFVYTQLNAQTVSTLVDDLSYTMNHSCVVASDGTIYSTDGQGDGSFNGDKVFKTLPDGTTSLFASGISGASGLAIDSNDNLYVSALLTGQIWKILPDGTATVEVVGTGNPAGLAFDSQGNLFIASFQNDLIVKVTPQGTGTVFTTTPEEPVGIIVDENDNLYVSHETPHIITKITPTGSVSTFANLPNTHLQYMTFFGDDILVTGFNEDKIYRVSPNGSVNNLAGGVSGYVDGDISAALFTRPTGIALSPDSTTLYIVEDNRIRRITGLSLSINEYQENQQIEIFPNPFENQLTISFEKPQKGELSFYDIKGSLVKTITSIEQSIYEINLSDLENGLYFYQWRNEMNTVLE